MRDSLILQVERSAEIHLLSNEISEDWRSLIQKTFSTL